jgi:hypothetical protein
MCVGLRLVGALAFQALLLLPGESPATAAAGAGSALVLVTISAYLALQAFRPDLLDAVEKPAARRRCAGGRRRRRRRRRPTTAWCRERRGAGPCPRSPVAV